MKPLDSVKSIRFTRDRALLHGAIDGFAGRKGDYAPRTPFEEQYIGRAPAAVGAARRQIVTAGLRELTMRMGELNADRGVIVLVSEGFPRDVPRREGAFRICRASSAHPADSTWRSTPSTPPLRRKMSAPPPSASAPWRRCSGSPRKPAGARSRRRLTAGLARLAHDLERTMR